ncbi:hypothetical protein EI94DRAFT_904633 [Lactarius quietus]|nr:hypothetical protein EI94DRAFT_904633 [Lactarius quietus]
MTAAVAQHRHQPTLFHLSLKIFSHRARVASKDLHERRVLPLATASPIMEHLPPTSDRRLDVCPRLQDIVQGQVPATSVNILCGSHPAEEASTNILKNMPPPSLRPYKKHFINCLVQPKQPGVLSHVPGILAGCGFTVDSLVVCSTKIGT